MALQYWELNSKLLIDRTAPQHSWVMLILVWLSAGCLAPAVVILAADANMAGVGVGAVVVASTLLPWWISTKLQSYLNLKADAMVMILYGSDDRTVGRA